MQTKNWGELLKLQDQYSKQEDLKLKKKHQLYKQLYKKQLQQTIIQQKHKKISDKDQQKQLIDYQIKKKQVAKDSMQVIQQQQKKNRERWQKVRETFSKQNYQSSFQRRMKEKEVLEQEKRKYSERFKKISTQESQQKQKQKRMYSEKKVDLAKAYDKQLHYQENLKNITKSQQQKIFQLGKRLQQQKQRERTNALNRVRFGYGQNRKVYDLSSQIIQRKSRERIDFIQKMASPSQIIQNQGLKSNYFDKQKKLKQVSSYNRYAFENKNLRKRLQTLQEKDFQHRKLEYLNQQIHRQQQQQRLRKDKERRQLQLELERQIAQFQEGRIRSKQLNPQQAKINKSLYRSQHSHEKTMLPGVAHDYSAQRHQRIIENFLRGDRKYTLE